MLELYPEGPLAVTEYVPFESITVSDVLLVL